MSGGLACGLRGLAGAVSGGGGLALASSGGGEPRRWGMGSRSWGVAGVGGGRSE